MFGQILGQYIICRCECQAKDKKDKPDGLSLWFFPLSAYSLGRKDAGLGEFKRGLAVVDIGIYFAVDLVAPL